MLCGIFSGAGAAERLCLRANRARRLVRGYKPDGPASQETRLIMPAMAARTFTRIGLSMAITLLGLLLAGSAAAFNYVADATGTYWGIQDDAPPRVDTGSIRATQAGPGQNGSYSTSINGFAGIRVSVQTTAAVRFNGEVMRGFGLRFDGVDRFKTTHSVDMGGVTISRSIYINRGANWGRWLDTFTNTTRTPVTIKVAFGGQSGTGAAGPNSSAIVNSSSGDARVTSADTWVSVATPTEG